MVGLNVGSLIEAYYWLVVEVENQKYGFSNIEEELDLGVLRKFILLNCDGNLSISHIKPQYFFNLLAVTQKEMKNERPQKEIFDKIVNPWLN